MIRRTRPQTSCASFQPLEGRVLLSGSMQLTPVGTYHTGLYAQASAEIVVYDPASTRMFIVNDAAKAVDVVHIGRPDQPRLDHQINVSAFGSPTSVAVRDNVVAIAVENFNPQMPGTVAFYKVNGQFISSVQVGALPDMLTFTPDGAVLLVANEGEPNSYGLEDSFDPEGSISIIRMPAGIGELKRITQASVVTAGFTDFNGRKDELIAAGIRIFGPGATVAQDLEPECIAVSADSTTAYVTLQEANALATINLLTGEVTSIVPLGARDYSSGPGLDASDKDKLINIRNWPVFGMYQPDEARAISIGGQTYLVMANEGDVRTWPGFNEETMVGNPLYTLDPTAFPDAAALKNGAALKQLVVTNATGDTDGDGDFDQIYAFGGRSFSIRAADGTLVYDSGDDFERITAEVYPANFNANSTGNAPDNRSDNKGPEPEALVTGMIDGRTYAFIALERIGGVMVYDISDPWSPIFACYVNNRNFAETPGLGLGGDLSPEGLAFISAADSPSGEPMLIVANEVSGTVTLFTIDFAQSTETVLAGKAAPAPRVASMSVTVPTLAGGSFMSGSRTSTVPVASRPLFGIKPIAQDHLLFGPQLDLLG